MVRKTIVALAAALLFGAFTTSVTFAAKGVITEVNPSGITVSNTTPGVEQGIQLSARGIIIDVNSFGTDGANLEFTPPGFTARSTTNGTVGSE